MGFLDDIVKKIDQFENAVNVANDKLGQTADRVEQGSKNVDSTIERTTSSVRSGADKVEETSQKVDHTIRTTVSGVSSISGDDDETAENTESRN